MPTPAGSALVSDPGKLPYTVVVTGGIASGKSTVTAAFETLGVPVFDADLVARQVVARGEPAWEAIRARWGDGVLAADGELDRSAMRTRVFADPEQRRELEAIIHPRVRDSLQSSARTCTFPYCILAIPLFVESAQYSWINRVLLVDVPVAMQRQRLQQRDGSSAEDADRILAAQASRNARWIVANDVLINDGAPQELLEPIRKLHRRYLEVSSAY